MCELPLHCVGESFCVHHALAALAACHTGAEGLLVTPFRWSQHINLSNTPCSVCLLMQCAGGSQCRLTVAHHHHPIGLYARVCRSLRLRFTRDLSPVSFELPRELIDGVRESCAAAAVAAVTLIFVGTWGQR